MNRKHQNHGTWGPQEPITNIFLSPFPGTRILYDDYASEKDLKYKTFLANSIFLISCMKVLVSRLYDSTAWERA